MRAISIRQPFAWAIIHAGKDVENRKRPSQFQAAIGRRVFIHASSYRMTAAGYADAVAFTADLGVACPSPSDLMYGGIIGSVLVLDVITQHRSRWFHGPAALVFVEARPEPFLPVRGQVGLFRVQSP